MNVPRTKLGEHLRIKHGFAFKSEHFGSRGDFVTLTPGNFRESGGLKSQGEKEKFYTAVPPQEFVLRRGDMLIVMTDLTQEARILGAPAMVPTDGVYLHNQRLGKVVGLRRTLDAGYLYHLMNWHAVRDQLKGSATGTTVRHTAPDRIYAVEVPLPPIGVQRRIAGVLSAYDDLIENNTRRIAILEEMARRLYEEWFVHFRFPGHETASLTDTPDGQLPEGWPLVRLDEVIDFDPRTHVPADNDIPFVPMTSLSTSSMTVGAVERRSTVSGSKFRNGDTLLARITPCLENGKTGYVDFLPADDTTACGSTEFIVMRGREVPPEFVQVLARSHLFRDHAIASMSGATGRQRVRREQLQGFKIARPPADLLARYGRVAASWFASVRNLARQNANIRMQRDLLLPKLVSGAIDLAAIEALPLAAE